jgi:HAD superfamily hydrolase (TIGR01509 family)
MMKNQLKIDLVIFDMDGLMFDTEKISYDAWKEAAALYNYQIDMGLFEKTIGANLIKTKEIYVEHFGDEFPLELISEARVKISEQIIKIYGVPIKHGLYELIQYLNHKKMKMAVATSTSRIRAMNLLRLAKIENYFDYILCGDEIINSKPNPEIFLKVASELRCTPRKCLVLEDSELGITAAYNAGMVPIMIPDLKEPSKAIQSLIFRRMNTLLEVKLFLDESNIL